MEALAFTTNTSYTAMTVKNLMNYKYLVVGVSLLIPQQILATTMIPIDYFIQNGSSFAVTATYVKDINYNASVYYSNDTEIYLKGTIDTYCCAILFGIR